MYRLLLLKLEFLLWMEIVEHLREPGDTSARLKTVLNLALAAILCTKREVLKGWVSSEIEAFKLIVDKQWGFMITVRSNEKKITGSCAVKHDSLGQRFRTQKRLEFCQIFHTKTNLFRRICAYVSFKLAWSNNWCVTRWKQKSRYNRSCIHDRTATTWSKTKSYSKIVASVSLTIGTYSESCPITYLHLTWFYLRYSP